MSQNDYLYIMVSGTGTAIAKTIRLISRYSYNHVSLSLDPSFQNWVSFARVRKGTPLVGSFVSENLNRLSSTGKHLPVMIFRVPIDNEKKQKLEKVFALADKQTDVLLYNSFDCLMAGIGRQYPMAGSYTCLSFGNAITGNNFLTIEDFSNHLMDHLYYQGDLWDLVTRPEHNPSETYFDAQGFFRSTKQTCDFFYNLNRRRHCRNSFPDPIAAILTETKPTIA